MDEERAGVQVAVIAEATVGGGWCFGWVGVCGCIGNVSVVILDGSGDVR